MKLKLPLDDPRNHEGDIDQVVDGAGIPCRTATDGPEQ